MSWLAPLVATAGGVVWGLCFGRQSMPLAAAAALVPLFLLLDRPRAGWLGWLHGVVAWLVAMPWIVPTLETYGGLSAGLAWFSLLLLALYLGSYHGLFALLAAPLIRRGALGVVGAAAVWVTLELVRAHLFSGFPWNLAAYAWTEAPGALPSSAWLGAYGVSFLLLVTNGAIAAAVRGRPKPAVALLLGCQLVLALGARWGAGAAAPGGAGRPVRLVQPNTENLAAWDPLLVRQNYAVTFELARQACDEAGALVVLPESAAWPYMFRRDEEYRRDLEALAAAGCTVVFNTTLREAGEYRNAALALDASGVGGRYDKRHLVPLGEYVPRASVFRFLQRIARNAGDYSPGGSPALLPWHDERLGPAICFEVIFPFETAELVRAGATILVTVTNDAWYGDTAAPWQHFRAARFRAAESRRPLIRAALTGISAIVEPDGSVRSRLDVGERGVLRGRLAGRRDPPPHARHPWLVPLLATLTAAAALTIARRRG